MNFISKNIVLTDEELIGLLRADEPEAVKEIYKKYWGSLLEYAFSFTRDKAEAKDIVQEVFVRMVVNEHLQGIQVSLKSYLFTCVKRDCVRFLRTRFSTVTLNDSYHEFLSSTHRENAAHPVQLKELEFHFEKELSYLPTRLRQVFELSRHQGLNSREISMQLGTSNQTVRNQLSQVIRILRQKLGSY